MQQSRSCNSAQLHAVTLMRDVSRVRKLHVWHRSKLTATTTIQRPLDSTTCVSQHRKLGTRRFHCSIFTVCMPLLVATGTLRLGRSWFPSVVWYIWFGGRKGIWPVKTERWEAGVWSKVQSCIWRSRCHCHSLSIASVKSRSVFTFLLSAHLHSYGHRAIKRALLLLLLLLYYWYVITQFLPGGPG